MRPLPSRVARLDLFHALGVAVDDAGEAGVAAFGVHSGFERGDVLAIGVAPAEPLALRLVERPLPARFLPVEQARRARRSTWRRCRSRRRAPCRTCRRRRAGNRPIPARRSWRGRTRPATGAAHRPRRRTPKPKQAPGTEAKFASRPIPSTSQSTIAGGEVQTAVTRRAAVIYGTRRRHRGALRRLRKSPMRSRARRMFSVEFA